MWDHKIKNYRNRDVVDKEWRKLSQTLNISSKYYCIAFVFGLYTNLSTENATSEIQDPATTAHLRAPEKERERERKRSRLKVIRKK